MLAKANAIMKRLRSTETLGSTSAINSDKTGTLTLNQMTAVEMTIPGRRYTISGGGYATEGTIKHVYGPPDVPLEQFLLPMALCADAVVKDGGLVGDPTEGALVVLAEKGGLAATETREPYPRIAELPFDAAYKFMGTFHRMQDESGRTSSAASSRAPRTSCWRAHRSGPTPEDLTIVPVDESSSSDIWTRTSGSRSQGLRVHGDRTAGLRPGRSSIASADLLPLLDGLTLLALVGIVDPAAAEAKAAIAIAHAAGIRVRMITGDHAVTAAAIASELGIPGRAITGAEFKAMSDAELDKAIDDIGVIARVAPEDKVRLVESLKRKGDIVAMTGDGVNDAPALKAADIGIAMGITGTEVSKEAAMMILTDDNFATIVKAVELGRGLYDNLTQVHPLPDGRADRLHRHVPRREHLQHRGRRAVRAAPDAVRELHDPGPPGDRPRLRPAGRRTDAAQAAARRTSRCCRGRSSIWVAIAGLVLGGTTLGLIAWADDTYGSTAARTMGLTTFAIGNVLLPSPHATSSARSSRSTSSRTACSCSAPAGRLRRSCSARSSVSSSASSARST